MFFKFSKEEIQSFKRSTGLFKKYRITYKKVLKEAKNRECEVYRKGNKQNKEMWQLINKQVGKCSSSDKKIELKTETGIVTHPQKWQRC